MRHRRMRLGGGVVVVALLYAVAAEAEAVAAEPTTSVVAQAVDTLPHPVVPDEPVWARPVFQAIGALFVLAAVLGPIIRRSVPQDVPPATHSHDEPPGASGLHGQSGIVEPDAPDRPKQ